MCKTGHVATQRSPRQRAAGGRRAELVAAAARVVSRDGVAAATTRRIAEEAGLPQGLVHYWFASKDELLQEVIMTLLGQFEEAAIAPVGSDVRDPAGYVLSAFRAAFAVVEADDPGRQVATYELTTWALRTPHLQDIARQQYAAYRETAEAIAAPWLAEHGRDFPGSADAMAQFVAALFDGTVLAWLADPEGTKPDEIFALAAELLGRGTRPAPAPPGEPGARTPDEG